MPVKLHCEGRSARPEISTPAASAGTRNAVVQAVITSVARVSVSEALAPGFIGSTPEAVSA